MTVSDISFSFFESRSLENQQLFITAYKYWMHTGKTFKISQNKTRRSRRFSRFFFRGGGGGGGATLLQCVGHYFVYVAHFWFFLGWIRTQKLAVTRRRTTNLPTPIYLISHPSLYLSTHTSNFRFLSKQNIIEETTYFINLQLLYCFTCFNLGL